MKVRNRGIGAPTSVCPTAQTSVADTAATSLRKRLTLVALGAAVAFIDVWATDTSATTTSANDDSLRSFIDSTHGIRGIGGTLAGYLGRAAAVKYCQ
jgi:hypothetical protein